MKFKGHFIWTFLYLFIIAYCIESTALVLIIIVAFIGTMPDIDYKIHTESHRFWLTHSLIFPLLAFVFYPNILTLLILLAFGHHLALDTVGNLIFGKKAVGYYTIVLIPSIEINFWLFKIKTRSLRLSGRMTTFYLLTNWIITLIILLVVIL